MKTVFAFGNFTDYAGNDRKFVMAAVSINECGTIVHPEYMDDFNKILSIGVAVCKPGDEYDPEIGQAIAKGKAIKNRDHVCYFNDEGLVNDTLVEALLEQEVEYFKKYPGHYLAGYDSDREKYQAREIAKEYEKQLKEPKKTVYNYLKGASKKELQEMMNMLCARK